jgi:hypothetical protein
MKRLISLFALLTVTFAAWGQAPTPGSAVAPKAKISPLADYAGVWTSTFDGKVWLRVEIELRGDQLVGSLVRPRDIKLNDNGELKSVSEEQSTATITEAVVNPDGLLLTVKAPDSQAADRYQMRLVSPAKDAAELKMIAMSLPPGLPKPKPWRLAKSTAATTSEATPKLADYAGDWVSTFDGKVWLLLQLELHGEHLTGWLTHSRDLEVNDDGDLKSVSDEKAKEEVADSTLGPEGLVLTVTNGDSGEPDQYVMQIVMPAKTAALTIVATGLPQGMPQPKPWGLLKFDAASGKAPAAH